ncbi:hypothetical protein BHM03_00043854, partial [Ensete ventricosum]
SNSNPARATVLEVLLFRGEPMKASRGQATRATTGEKGGRACRFISRPPHKSHLARCELKRRRRLALARDGES